MEITQETYTSSAVTGSPVTKTRHRASLSGERLALRTARELQSALKRQAANALSALQELDGYFENDVTRELRFQPVLPV